jgi:hypothetical protein
MCRLHYIKAADERGKGLYVSKYLLWMLLWTYFCIIASYPLAVASVCVCGISGLKDEFCQRLMSEDALIMPKKTYYFVSMV